MYGKRRLPHWVPDDIPVFVTWRLAGTVPQPPEAAAPDLNPGRTFLLQDRELDRAQSGPSWLKNPRIADIFVDALLHGESVRHDYELIAWVVMPNHVHVVLKPIGKLPEIMRWLKAATAKRANRVIGRRGEAFWQREYYDRWIRSDKELSSVISYVEGNPVSAGLVASPEDWIWSSAKSTGD
jgi:REP element-mobilizing transposase RayT